MKRLTCLMLCLFLLTPTFAFATTTTESEVTVFDFGAKCEKLARYLVYEQGITSGASALQTFPFSEARLKDGTIALSGASGGIAYVCWIFSEPESEKLAAGKLLLGVSSDEEKVGANIILSVSFLGALDASAEVFSGMLTGMDLYDNLAKGAEIDEVITYNYMDYTLSYERNELFVTFEFDKSR